MTRPFDSVVVLFNPHSTGDAKARAQDLARELSERNPDLAVTLVPTEHAGHARDIARDAALAGRPLIVSVSGDGGYNEVVDGVTQAATGTAVAAVLAAGNANDHRRVTRERPLADGIIAGDVSRIDLLKITIGEEAEPCAGSDRSSPRASTGSAPSSRSRCRSTARCSNSTPAPRWLWRSPPPLCPPSCDRLAL